tara:strand:+ start:1195 stop:2115 length:921 start_codon:yes stop_codon:yes gene_type:complete
MINIGISKNYVFPIFFLLVPTIISLLLFIEQNILSYGSYIYELHNSNKWYSKDLDLKNKSWDEVKVEIKLFKGTIDVINENFSKDVYDKNTLHVLTMQAHKKVIIFNHYFSSLDKEKHKDFKIYESMVEECEIILGKLIDYNKNMIKPKYTTEFSNIISIIFLPLAVITGYFGMNFSSMGIHGKKELGVYNESQGQLFVFIISLIVSIIFIYIIYEINKPYGGFEYIFKGKNKFTLTELVFGDNKKNEISKTPPDINIENNVMEYDLKNPPPSLNTYKKEVDSLAPPINRDDELGPYDNSLFEYKL